MQVYENLHWLNGNGNLFLYQQNDGDWLLVDSGMPGKADVVGYLRKLGHQPSALKHILITHADVDHAGNVAAIQKATGATVYASAQSAELMQAGTPPSHNKRWMTWMADRFMQYEKVSAEAINIVADGDDLPIMGGLRVIAAPGHTLDQVAYYSVAHGLVFAGDALFALGKKLRTSYKAITYDHDLARHSATKLVDLSPVMFCCGHGKPFLHTFDDVMAFFASARQ